MAISYRKDKCQNIVCFLTWDINFYVFNNTYEEVGTVSMKQKHNNTLHSLQANGMGKLN